MVTVKRYHDICAGHRVVGHEGKCRNLHGHNYRVHFECVADQLDSVGRVIDFSVIKERLCMWLEEEWDHKMLLWTEDPAWDWLISAPAVDALSVRGLPFNPTAENMAIYLLHTMAPYQLQGTGILVKRVIIEETTKCLAEASL